MKVKEQINIIKETDEDLLKILASKGEDYAGEEKLQHDLVKTY